MRKRVLPAALAAVAMGAAAGSAAAQSCLGLPTRDGQIAVAGIYTDAEGDPELGGEFVADVTGPGSLGFSFGTTDDPPERNTYAARGAYDLYLLEPSICAVGGIFFQDYSDSVIEERLGIPLGIGFGKMLDVGRASATVYAIPQYVWLREVRTDALGDEDVDTSNEFLGEAGVTLGILPFFVGAGIMVSTVDDGDPAFRLRAGIVF